MYRLSLLTKNSLIKYNMRKKYINIKFWKKLYLKKMYIDINRKVINDILECVKKNEFYSFDKNININDELSKKNKAIPANIYFEDIKKINKQYYVSTRLLNATNIVFPNKKTGFFFKPTNIDNKIDTLMIFMHGGGFVGLSTFQCEGFLRKWSTRLKIPIIGINYVLAPEHKYPEGLNDCWQAYNWIIENAEKEFGITPKNIIVSGESAGATFALSLTFLSIITKTRVPDLVLNLYAGCDTSSKNVSVSMLRSIDDFMLSFDALFYVSEAYRGDYENDDDFFLNPEKCPDFILKNLPKTRFFLSNIDPLRDGNMKLASKIAKFDNVDFKVYEFKDICHGFAGTNPELSLIPNNFVLEEIEEFLKNRNN